MASRRFPDNGSRWSILRNGDRAQSKTITYFSDPLGQHLAEVYAERGTDNPAPADALVGSSTTLTAFGEMVPFRGPLDGTARLYGQVGTDGPIFPIDADPHYRLADLEGSSASDSLVVHKSGAESIDGIKTFSSSPLVPITPTAQAAAAPKAYVDAVAIAVLTAANQTAVPATRQIATPANSGLTGGGDLSTNRSLAVDFGTTSTTVARGDEPAAAQAAAIASAAATAAALALVFGA